MRKSLVIVGSIAGALILALIALFIYAAANLNAIVAENRGFLLQRLSAALGRKIEVAEIKAHLGWGVSADLSYVEIADDPDFSSRPFVSASEVSAKLELIPLLVRQLRVSKVVLQQPEIRVVRNGAGQLNLSTIGRKTPGQTVVPEKSQSGGGGATNESPMREAPRKSGGGAIGAPGGHNPAAEPAPARYERT